MTSPIARRFAQFAVSEASCPEDVRQVADRAMLDTIGAMVAGGAHDATQRVAKATSVHAGPATCATGGNRDVETAALINGTAAHAWDIDDTSYTGIMHGSAVIAPVVLAVAQDTGADADLQRQAFIVGSEVTYVLAELCTHDHYFRGWWSTVTFSLAGATAAAGVLLGLNEYQMTAAIGLAAASSGGGKSVFGTDAKPFLVGDAGRRAITFAKVALTGLCGPEEAFEDNRGYLQLLNNGSADMSVLDSLGSRWRLVQPGLLFKTNPVCSAAHAAIDQMNALMRELNALPGDIEEVRAEVPELVDISLVYPDPQTPQQAQFSLPYALACAALHGRVRFEDLLPDTVGQSEKAAFMARVHTERAADLSTDTMREKFPESARLTLTLKDGRTASGFCGTAYGMPDNPLSEEDLLSKFETAAAFAGRKGMDRSRLGENPAELFARIMR